MHRLKYLALAVFAGLLTCSCLTVGAPPSSAQVSVDVGVAPDCPYGYYDYAPYACAPYGYYGPEWFSGGVFIGAGPWFHGSADFKVHVNNHYDLHHGYKGPMPNRGEKREESKRPEEGKDFKANETRDGRGHVVNDKHPGH